MGRRWLVVIAIGFAAIASGAAQQSPAPLLPQPGTLNTSFGTTGLVISSLGPGHDVPIEAAIQLDGKIVVLGDVPIAARDVR